MPKFDRIAIIGVGLIGGSIGLAVRQRELAREIVGIGRRQATLDDATALGAIDRGSTELAEAAGADLAIVATPVDTVAVAVRGVAAADPRTLITDAGSAKGRICDELSELTSRFVGSHPLAGDHRRGPRHARADLFVDRTVVVTPLDAAPVELVEQITDFWGELGARVESMSPTAHDAALAVTSHLPHLVSAALASATPSDWLPLTATGWADATRIAAGDAEIWTQIFAQNRHPLLAAVEQYESCLGELRKAIESNQWDDVQQLLTHAKRIRDALGD